MGKRVLDGLKQALVELCILAFDLQPYLPPKTWERSRTMRGIFEKMFETGCMRAFMTFSRRSAVTMSRRRESMVMFGSLAVACSTWLRVSTSSPTRFIMRLSRVTSTRRELSAALAIACGRGFSASVCTVGLAGRFRS